MEEAAAAGVVAAQGGVVTSYCCGRVHSVPARRVVPPNEDGGIVALSEDGDTREQARCWRTGKIYFTEQQK